MSNENTNNEAVKVTRQIFAVSIWTGDGASVHYSHRASRHSAVETVIGELKRFHSALSLGDLLCWTGDAFTGKFVQYTVTITSDFEVTTTADELDPDLLERLISL